MPRILSVLASLALLLSSCGCQGQLFRLISNHNTVYDVPTTEASVERGHHYFYYPALEIYYCTEHTDWAIREGGVWRTVKHLPSRIIVSSSAAFVEVAVVGPAPWRYFDEHHRQYPAGWRPPPNKKFPIAKVKIGG